VSKEILVTTPYQHRRDPQPVGRGGEIAFVALAGVLLALALAALLGLGVASAVFGGGWVWPHGTGTIGHVLAGLLTGHPGRGLPSTLAARVPGAIAVYSCVALTELALLVASIAAAVLFLRFHRPGDARGGMATRHETHQVLGVSRLREAKTLIRPDLDRARNTEGTDR